MHTEVAAACDQAEARTACHPPAHWAPAPLMLFSRLRASRALLSAGGKTALCKGDFELDCD